ncbi:MAG: DNA polymerase III subunit delta [Anaerolineales bacterium]
MSDPANIIIFHGDDEAAMRAEVGAMQSQLGDPATADMNTTRIEGAISLDELRNATQAVPFLSQKRLVAVRGAAKAFSAAAPKVAFLKFLEDLAPSTQLVLIEIPALDAKQESRPWLLKWAKDADVQVRKFELPQGAQMTSWLQQRTKTLGGDMRPAAAAALELLIGSDTTAAQQEIDKLLAYTGYQRPIQASDVAAVSLPAGEQGDFFKLVDALAAHNSATAMKLLQTLLAERERILLFFSLVAHFRLLLQSREMVEAGKKDVDIASHFHMHPYRAQKLAEQARRFSLSTLESIYQQLLVMDEQIKTGKMEADLAMETFVASLSLPTV